MNRSEQRLLLVDQSLKGPGGHHFDYVLQTIKAATTAGHPTLLATHRRFRETSALLDSLEGRNAGLLESGSTAAAGDRPTAGLPPGELPPGESPLAELTVSPLFHLTTYSHWSDLEGLRRMTPRRLKWPQRIKDYLRHREARLRSAADPLSETQCRSATSHLSRQQQWVVRVFCRDLVAFLRQVQPRPTDALFFTTVSELEFLAMAIVASSYPELCDCQWHVQFHFDLFFGRPHEYKAQASRPENQRVMESFRQAQSGLAQAGLADVASASVYDQ